MDYRREIDGLRAIAVLPVILFHAGVGAFSGGFVGVDVFFVISGYLITTIIVSELEQSRFSVVNFYERRARRILPTLFLAMFLSFVFGYFLLMPDEFKNFGQSLVATSLFSNNVLLALTSGYWDLASEFKPLLHTWSLGVEEQYYVIVPLLLVLCWRIRYRGVLYLHWVIFLASLSFAVWLVKASPDWAFYTLPARAWEIAIEAIASLYLRNPTFSLNRRGYSKSLDFVGLLLILLSVFCFDQTVLSPGLAMLLPTLGAVLIIIFCRPGSFVYPILSSRICVYIGLLSYSLYIWHQPIFAYMRAYLQGRPSYVHFLALLPLVFLLAYLSWRFVETPFRDRTLVSRKSVLGISVVFSALFIASGFFLNNTYGVPGRVFDSTVRVEDMDKRIYNERAFLYKADSFSGNSGKNVLIIGNSFARDFLNITLESFDVIGVELVYRDDLAECIGKSEAGSASHPLFVQADVIVFASGEFNEDCVSSDLSFARDNEKHIYYVGTKNFGYNLNWLIRFGGQERANRLNVIADSVIESDLVMGKAIPDANYISLLRPVLQDGKIPVTDSSGHMLSTDRAHLTKFGAIYFGNKAVVGTGYSNLFM